MSATQRSKLLKIDSILSAHGVENASVVAGKILDALYPDRSPTLQQAMVGALAEVMRLDAALNGPRLAPLAALLLRQGYSADDVRRAYGPGGGYWQGDWRGKRGELPGERSIRETILTLTRQAEPVATYRIVA